MVRKFRKNETQITLFYLHTRMDEPVGDFVIYGVLGAYIILIIYVVFKPVERKGTRSYPVQRESLSDACLSHSASPVIYGETPKGITGSH